MLGPSMPDGDFALLLPKMDSSHAHDGFGLDADRLGGQPRMFKKHKVLPHPRKDDPQRPPASRYGTRAEAPPSQHAGSPGSSPHRPQRPRRVGRAPEPPPTPPAHSRTSSASRPADLSSPVYAGSSRRAVDHAESRPPATPPLVQQTPPTPNLTPERAPPGPAARQAHLLTPINDRAPSKYTTDSRTESFMTAHENPGSSDDDDERSTLRPAVPSARTSQGAAVRQLNGDAKRLPQPVGLGLRLESGPGPDPTPGSARDVNTSGGDWPGAAAGTDDVEEGWDSDRWRNVTLRKRRPAASRAVRNHEVADDVTVRPANATKALRSTSLQESPVFYPSRRVVSDQLPAQAAVASSESSGSTDFKRSSAMSTGSAASTVVEAIVVETTPQRRRTLRHMKKQSTLRAPGPDASRSSSAPTSVSAAVDDARDHQNAEPPKTGGTARESQISTATCSSLSSRKARREVWKSGGVPVVVIPERRSSVKGNSREPSLRSTSSRRSLSPSSVPVSQTSKGKEHVPRFERPRRRSRALSESDGSRAGDQRTLDFPPVIPARSSSLSAPTSRNASRAGSLTAESLRAHNLFQAQQAHRALQKASEELDRLYSRPLPPVKQDASHARGGTEGPFALSASAEIEHNQETVSAEHTPHGEPREYFEGRDVQSNQDPRDVHDTDEEHGREVGLGVDSYGDLFGKRLSAHNTPFSAASVDTTGTSHAEVSEAMAVSIYPHHSKSVVLVDNTARPSENSSLDQTRPPEQRAVPANATAANGDASVTPPQQLSMNDVDSPLRNPRAPPKPPVINLIPATPSGLTPSIEKEKQLGNYYEMTEEKPKRSLSLLRRALSRRRKTGRDPSPARPVGLLTRTFSLSRNIRKRSDDWMDGDVDGRPGRRRRSTFDDEPADETRLHPFWRPAYAGDESPDTSDDEEYPPDDRTYRYPPIDNRPSLPRRSLSARIKRTFAILPLQDDRYDEYYPAVEHDPLDRRTIRRTPSGNLRVTKRRRSMEFLARGQPGDAPPDAAPEQSAEHPGGVDSERPAVRLWRSLSVSRARPSSSRGPSGRGHGGGGGGGGEEEEIEWGGLLPGWSDKINLHRRLSERRRERRMQELRRNISGPTEVRDGVDDVVRGTARGDAHAHAQPQLQQQHCYHQHHYDHLQQLQQHD